MGQEGGYTSPLAPPASPQVLTEESLGPGKTRMASANGALVNNNAQLRIECARILQERGLVFQFSGLLTSASFNCDEKKVLYLEQKGSSPCTNPGLL